MRNILKTFIGFIIQWLEMYQFRHQEFDENDISKKIIDEQETDFYVESPEGYSHVSRIYKTQPYHVYRMSFTDGTELEAADNHILYKRCGRYAIETHLKDFVKGDTVIFKNANKNVKSVKRLPYKMSMYDMSVDSKSHKYYTSDGALNHNTTTISSFIAWMLVFHIDKNILIVANKEKTAIEIVDKIINIFKGLPFFLKPGTLAWGKTSLKLDNGSKVISSATTNTASIGFTIHLVLLDEFAHIPENIVNNFWRSVYPTLSSSKVSQCIITSTPNGTTNKFYDIWSKSIEGKNSFVHMRTDYWEVPGHDNEWAEQMKKDFGEEEFAQEFELQFNINSKMLLKAEDLKFIERVSSDYVHKQIYIDNQYLNSEYLKWHPDFDPNDIDPNDKFIMLVDISEGNADAEETRKGSGDKTPDSNTISIMRVRLNSIANMRRYSKFSCGIKDAFRYEQVGVYSCDCEDEVQEGKVASALAYDLFMDHERNSVRVMVEMNFNGKSFTESFNKHPEYSDSTILRTYHTKPVPGEKQRKRLGFKTTANKEYYCSKGNKMINMKRVIPTETRTFEQMKSFGYVKGKLKGIACHDDLAMPMFNHISRMLDESSFVSWLEEILYDYPDTEKRYKINQLIEKWDFDNPEVSDSDFNSIYGVGMSTSPYSENLSYNVSTNPYSMQEMRYNPELPIGKSF